MTRFCSDFGECGNTTQIDFSVSAAQMTTLARVLISTAPILLGEDRAASRSAQRG
jgi:hypothetical protein